MSDGRGAPGGRAEPRFSGSLGGITLVVPVRDEAATIPALIESILAQRRPPDEVIIVDGGSHDATVELCRTLVRSEPRFRLIEAGPATPGRGRNVGIAAAHHEWIALTDAGIVLDPGWLAALEAAAAQVPGCSVVWGTYEPVLRSAWDRWAALAYVAPRAPSPKGPLRGPSVASALLRRRAWEAAGGFPDLRAAEDLIFIERLRQSGAVEAWAPEAKVLWGLPAGPRATFRRFRSYSCHNVLAGRQRYWHHGVARLYLGAAALALAAKLLGARPGLPLAAAGLARVVRSIWRRSEDRSLLGCLRPDRLLGVAAVLVVLDTATFAGWLDAIRTKQAGVLAESSGAGLERGMARCSGGLMARSWRRRARTSGSDNASSARRSDSRPSRSRGLRTEGTSR